jgi:hypothetical protein
LRMAGDPIFPAKTTDRPHKSMGGIGGGVAEPELRFVRSPVAGGILA